MIRRLLRLLTRPLVWVLAAAPEALRRLRLGRSGVIEVVLDAWTAPVLTLHLALFEQAALQPGVKAVLLHLRQPSLGWADLQEWRAVLVRLRDQGLLVVARLDDAGNAAAYLASACDHVSMPALGSWSATGPSARMSFYGDALERWGVRFELQAAGQYKSFGETFTRAYATAENREAISALVGNLHRGFVEAVAEGRQLTVDEVEAQVQTAPLAAAEALAAGLVDHVGYEDELTDWLEESLGAAPRLLSVRAALRVERWQQRLDGLLSDDKLVVVLRLSGPVVMAGPPGRGGPRIAAVEVPGILRDLRDHPRVAALVLSVDSPGGSALASDLIWREVELFKRERPVVAAFGNVAASGGYYISAAATEIVARPGTLTGSIGVVGGKVVLGEALGRLGVYGERVARGRNAGWLEPDAPFDEAQRERFRAQLDSIYETFLQRVSAGRRRPRRAIEEVARGRVWTGRAAVEAGLVDHLGGIDLAVSRARSLAGLRPGGAWRRVDLLVRPPRTLTARLMSAFGMQGPELTALLPPWARLLQANPATPLALLPIELELH